MRYILLASFLAFSIPLFSQDLHYHETGGFGTDKVYGIDEKVYRVTNLNKEGEGSLRYCLEQKGPRLIIFEVGGIIDLEEKDIVIKNDSVTVAGQTAPYPGITLIKGSLRVAANDVLVQHLTIRPGDGGYSVPTGWEPDGVSITSASVVFDHCSVSWAIDENMSVARGGNNITFYRCIIAEGLSNGIHAKGEHSCGSLVTFDTKNISIIGCLYAHNYRRNPRYADGAKLLFANNVIYNYGIYASHVGANVGAGNPDDPGIADFIGNAYFKGIDGWDNYMLEAHQGDFDKNNPPGVGKAYLKDNIGLDRVTGDLLIPHDEHVKILESPHVKPEAFHPIPAYNSIEMVLKHSGARPAERNTTDVRIVQSLIDGIGSVIDSQEEVGSYPDDKDSTRIIESIPSTYTELRAWLDSISTSLELAGELDVSMLYNFIDEHNSVSVQMPNTFSLFRSYPKFTTGNITISFSLKNTEIINIYLLDIMGRKLQIKNNLFCEAGFNEYTFSIDKQSIPNGLYLLVLASKEHVVSEKILLK